MRDLERGEAAGYLLPRALLPIGTLALLVHGLAWAPVWFPLKAAAGLIWAGWVPGWLALRLLLADDRSLDGVERALLASGLACVSLVVGTLILHLLPGPLGRTQVLLFYDLLIAGLVGMAVRGGVSTGLANWWRLPRTRPWPMAGGLLMVALVAAPFRLLNLGYSEFQGDEAKVLIKAAAVIQGIEGALFLHKKGPAEILITALPYAVAGRMSEAPARLPFALANMGGVLALWMVGRRYGGRGTGRWAAVLIALNGYFVAFARIVQYQSLVCFLSCLVMLCLHRLWSAERPRPLLVLMALFVATGLLAHYDMAFVLLPAGYVLWRRWLARPSERRRLLGEVAMATPLALAPLGLFYVPYARHPHFTMTADYITHRVGGYPPYANFRHLFWNSTIYNSIYYVALMAALLIGVVLWRLSRVGGEARWPGRALAVSFGVAALSLAIRPAWWSPGPSSRNWSVVLFGGALAALLGSRANEARWKAVLLWFAAPFFLYTFLVRDPRTHLYAMFPPWALLSGQGLAQVLRKLRGRAARGLARGALAGVLLLSSLYLYWMFVQHMVEVRRTYPRYRLPIYWTPYGDRFPKVGLFGFPYRVGWKVIGALYADGTLSGDYGSNEEPEITRWYTRGAFRCDGDPRYYVIAEQVQDSYPVPRDKIAEDYVLVGMVQVDGRSRMQIYERKPARLGYSDYTLRRDGARFDAQLSAPDLDTALEDGPPERQHPVALRLGGDIELLGYDLSARTVHAGEPFYLTLYWRTRRPIAADYKVFVHLARDGVVAAQKDARPCCWRRPTASWAPDEVIVDPYCLVVAPEALDGEYPLRVGMYLLETGQRLEVFADDGRRVGDAVELGRLRVVGSDG